MPPLIFKEIAMVLILFLIIVYVVCVALAGMIVLAWLGCQRVAMHLQDKPDATKTVVEHVLMPLFGRKDVTSIDPSRDAFTVEPDTDRS